jgi:hypothetical protein
LPLFPHAQCDGFRRILVGIKGVQSAPSPACKLIGLTYLLVSILLQPVCEFKEGAQQGSPVIVHQLGQPGLLDQPAEFDQMPCACAPVLHPSAGVMASTVAIEAVTQHGQVL